MALPFDPKTLTLSGQPVRVAGDVNFDSGVWRGVFSASENGALAYQIAHEGAGGQLAWFDSAGRQISTIGEVSEAYSPRLSTDGKRASVVLGDPNNDVWVYELDRGVKTRLTTEGLVALSPLWSPDSSQIVFATQVGSEDFVLTMMASDGAGERKVLHRSKQRIEPSDWSRDGRYLLYSKGNIGATDIWALPLAEPDKEFPLVQSPFLEMSGQFSPDSRWISYVSRETGRDEVYVTPFPGGGARWQISGGGGRQPRWSHDGKTLFFVSLDNELTAATVDGRGSRFDVLGTKPLFRVNMFIGPRIGVPGYDVASDGQRFLINSAGDASAPRLELVVNWDADLQK